MRHDLITSSHLPVTFHPLLELIVDTMQIPRDDASFRLPVVARWFLTNVHFVTVYVPTQTPLPAWTSSGDEGETCSNVHVDGAVVVIAEHVAACSFKMERVTYGLGFEAS